jgi:hypothetical protein
VPEPNPVARLRADLKAWRAAWLADHPDPVHRAIEEESHADRFRAFPPLTLHRQARGDGSVYEALLVEVGYLVPADA